VFLEKQLQGMDTSWAVLNAGVSGNDPFFDWKMVQKLWSDFAVERIVFLVNTTDVHDVQIRGGMGRFLPSGELAYSSGPWWEPVYAVSLVSRLFFHGVMKVEKNLMTAEEHVRTMRHAAGLIAGLFRDHVLPCSQESGTDVLVVLHPLSNETDGSTTVYELLRDSLMAVGGLRVTDCRTCVTDSSDSESLYWPNDRHFKPEGYARLAQCIFERNFAPS
jgi:hypothetical protein